jgi:HPr kinase/phosphorylase
MQIHASCAARDGAGVLLLGPPGSGKSDLALRLLDRGFMLVADDRVEVEDGVARPPPQLAGLLEVRGLGILRLPHVPSARLALAVELGGPASRLPAPATHPELGLPLMAVDAGLPSAAQRVALALECVLGRVSQVAGAFAP